MYLASDAWRRRGVLKNISVEFNTATPGLFGVKEFVPPLMDYVRDYGIALHLGSKLVEVNGPARTAVFERKTDAGVERVESTFDMLHVVPPQVSPKVVRESAIAGSDLLPARRKAYAATRPLTGQRWQDSSGWRE